MSAPLESRNLRAVKGLTLSLEDKALYLGAAVREKGRESKEICKAGQ